MHPPLRRLPTRTQVLAVAALALAPGSWAAAGEVFLDDFSDPSSGWPNAAATRDSDLGFAVYTDGGGYQLTPVQDQVFGFVAAPVQPARDAVRIAADLFLSAGIGAGAAGVGCRQRDPRNFYAFMVRGDAVTMILRIRDGVVTPLATGRAESIVPGTVDTRIEAECSGSTLRMQVRGGDTLQATDDAFPEGDSGLFVIGQHAAGTSALFDNLRLAARSPR